MPFALSLTRPLPSKRSCFIFVARYVSTIGTVVPRNGTASPSSNKSTRPSPKMKPDTDGVGEQAFGETTLVRPFQSHNILGIRRRLGTRHGRSFIAYPGNDNCARRRGPRLHRSQSDDRRLGTVLPITCERASTSGAGDAQTPEVGCFLFTTDDLAYCRANVIEVRCLQP